MQNGLQQTSFPSGIYFDVEKLSLPTMASYKWENNGIYFRNGGAVKLEEPLHEASVSHLTRVILKIQETYLKNTQVHCYYSVIPQPTLLSGRMVSHHGLPLLVKQLEETLPHDLY